MKITLHSGETGATRLSSSLAGSLRQAENTVATRPHRAVVMHDFSLDWIVRVSSFETFVERARTVLRQGGGLLPDSSQAMQQGGCAANTATTLARLGVATYFISRTDQIGKHLMEYYLGRAGVLLDRVKTDGDHSRVMVLEAGSEVTNIMVNDQKSFVPFDYDNLSNEDIELISGADVVGIFDWTLNGSGTGLADRLLSSLGDTRPITYLDTSDPAPRAEEIPELFRRVLSHRTLDHISVNENELRQYAERLEANAPAKESGEISQILTMAQNLEREVSARLNVHTGRFSLAMEGDETHIVPTYRAIARRATGAGDTWNGANIAGILYGLPVPQRLLMANAVAAFYVESRDAQRPTLAEVIDFVENRIGDLRDRSDFGEPPDNWTAS